MCTPNVKRCSKSTPVSRFGIVTETRLETTKGILSKDPYIGMVHETINKYLRKGHSNFGWVTYPKICVLLFKIISLPVTPQIMVFVNESLDL